MLLCFAERWTFVFDSCSRQQITFGNSFGVWFVLHFLAANSCTALAEAISSPPDYIQSRDGKSFTALDFTDCLQAFASHAPLHHMIETKNKESNLDFRSSTFKTWHCFSFKKKKQNILNSGLYPMVKNYMNHYFVQLIFLFNFICKIFKIAIFHLNNFLFI